MSQDVAARTQSGIRTGMWKRVAQGSLFGLAWAASLRGWMTVLALKFGETPSVSWSGTFGGILIPSLFMGAAVGWAIYDAETAGGKRWRWVLLSPLFMVLGPIVVTPDFFGILFSTGLGGGAIMVVIIGMAGGYALSGFGPAAARWASGLLSLLFALAAGYGFFSGTSSLQARDLFGTILFVTLMAMFAIGLSAPSRYHVHRSNSS